MYNIYVTYVCPRLSRIRKDGVSICHCIGLFVYLLSESKLLQMKKYIHLATAIFALIVMPAAGGCSHGDNADLNHARTMMKTIFSLYRVDETPLLAENYPAKAVTAPHIWPKVPTRASTNTPICGHTRERSR